MNKLIVSIVKSDSKNCVEKSLELIKAHKFLNPQKSVLIKPNIVRPVASGSGIITNVKIVSALINYLKKLGFSKIAVGEGSGKFNLDTTKAFKIAGYNTLKVPLIDFNQQKGTYFKKGEFEGRIANTIFNFDYLINVPVMKCHKLSKVTLSLKNTMGCLVGNKWKSGLHKEFVDYTNKQLALACAPVFNRRLIELNKLIKWDLVLTDGTVGREIDLAGKKIKPNIVVAGYNPVSVDAVCTKAMGINPHSIEHITLAEKAGLGTANLQKIEVIGEPIKKVEKKFELHPFWK